MSNEFDALKIEIKELIEASMANGINTMKTMILEREQYVFDKFRDLEVTQSSMRENIGQKEREISKIFNILDSMREDEKIQASKLQDIVSSMEARYKMWNMLIAVAGVAAALVVYFVGK